MEDLELQGVSLDYDKILADYWTLYFTSGTYYYNNTIRNVEPVVMSLLGQDFRELTVYTVYYNPKTNKYSIVSENAESDYCTKYGFNLGGFTINGCELKYQYPVEDCVRHVRAFDDKFNTGYTDIDTEETCDTGCQSFTFEFSTEFNTELTDCDDKGCGNSIGTSTGTEFVVHNFLLPECVIAKIDCDESVGTSSGTEFIIPNRLYTNCPIAAI